VTIFIKGKDDSLWKRKAMRENYADMAEVIQQEGKDKETLWEQPPDGWVECNVDPSFISDERHNTRFLEIAKQKFILRGGYHKSLPNSGNGGIHCLS
jgi:hypothetical protein